MSAPTTSVREQAQAELAQEQFRAAVTAEKARLRAIAGRNWLQRLIAAFPFTITRKSK